MKGERAISARFALALEEVLGIPAEFWIRRLQKGYECDLELIELRKMKQAS